MEAIRVHKIIAKNGETAITGLPYKKGQSVEIMYCHKFLILIALH